MSPSGAGGTGGVGTGQDGDGDGDDTDALAVVEHELGRKSTRRRVLEALASAAVVVVFFAVVIPSVSDAHYSEIWAELSRLTWAQLLGLAAVWAASMLLYTGVLTTTLPGLTHPQALTVNLAGSAVSNVVPFGGAVGVAATYAICRSWGFRMAAVTLSVLVSGVWNVFTKLGLPIIALALLVAFDDDGSHTARLVIPTVAGLLALAVAVSALALIMRSETLATRVGGAGQRVVTPAARRLHRSSAPDVVRAVLDFRHRSIGLLRARWIALTGWMLAYNLTQYLLLLGCVRAIGVDNSDLGWVQVFAAFAFARLLETIPLTPSGVGFVEAGAVAALIGFGGADAGAAAAVFLFRGFTYVAEIPLGALAWATWMGRRSWRRGPRERDATFEPVRAEG